jgi:hypothetical protein
MCEDWAIQCAEAGHDGDLTISLPPDLFKSACKEADALSGYRSRLPSALTVVALGNDALPAWFKFEGPSGRVTVRPTD